MRITAFLGAGTSLEIDGPLATDLTSLVRAKQQHYFDLSSKASVSVDLINEIGDILDKYFQTDRSNFEEIFYTLEMLGSYSSGWNTSTAKRYKPPFGAFVDPKNKKHFIPEALISAKHDLISVVADRINKYSTTFDPLNVHNWFASFWSEAVKRCPWDIGTLNYDNCIEASISSFEDGFEPTGQGFMRFSPHKLLGSSETTVLHLHGNILYGYPNLSDPNQYVFEDSFEDLYKFDTYDQAKATWFGRSNNTAQSHEEAVIGPIITGLRKTDKLLTYPYGVYYQKLQQGLMDSPRLLIVGYSFGDLHFNQMLERMVRLHGNNRRIVIISYFADPDNWCPDPSVMDWPGHEMFTFIAKSFKDAWPFKSHSFRNPIVSTDGYAKLYLCGFKHAISNHGQEILDFLTT